MKILVIDGIIGWDVTGREVRRQLTEASGEAVEVQIASPGGFVYDGLEIFNLIREYSRNTDVSTRLIGLAASMASYIALAGKKVIAEDNAVFMIHNAWSLALGDYREMQKEASELEGLTNLLAKAYAKKSGKSLSVVRELMDAETFLYGEEGKEAGFIDEIIETEKKESDRKDLILQARGRVKNCFDRMRESEKAKGDIQRAAALFNFQSVNIDRTPPQDNQENKKLEVNMNLTEFLSQNPDAKAVYDNTLQGKYTEGVAAGKKAVRDDIGRVIPFINNEHYPGESIRNLATKVLTGETTADSFISAIAAYDMMAEQQKTKTAIEETKEIGETPGEQHDIGSTDGVIRNVHDQQIRLNKIISGGEGDAS